MRNPSGYLIITGPDALIEQDTFVCSHCGNLEVADKEWNKGFCTLCYKPICNTCEATGECKPFEKKLEELETQEIRRRRWRGIIGY